MRTGAIFARGSCRALKWMALFGVVFALGTDQALAQATFSSGAWSPGGNAVELTMSGAVYGSPATTQFVVTVTPDSGTPATNAVTAINMGTTSGSPSLTITLTVTNPIMSLSTVAVAYTAPTSETAAGHIKDSGGDNTTTNTSITTTERNSIPTLTDVADLALRVDMEMTPFVLPKAVGGNGAITYALDDVDNTTDATGGDMPPGLTFTAETRVLSGTPTASATYNMSYTATDAATPGSSNVATQTFTITVSAAPAPVVVGSKGLITDFELVGDVMDKTIAGEKRHHVPEGSQGVDLSVTVQWTHKEIEEIDYNTLQTIDVRIMDGRGVKELPDWLSWIDEDGQDVHFPRTAGATGTVRVRTPRESQIPVGQRGSPNHTKSVTGTLDLLILHDDHEAENDAFYIMATGGDVMLDVRGGLSRTSLDVVIEDDEEQKVRIRNSKFSTGPTNLYEPAGDSTIDSSPTFHIDAVPPRRDLPLEVRLDIDQGQTVSAAQISLGAATLMLNDSDAGTGNSATVDVNLPDSDGNRMDDSYTLNASVNVYSVATGGYRTIPVAEHAITVLDRHRLPWLVGDELDPSMATVAEGGMVELEVTIDRNPSNTFVGPAAINSSDVEKRLYSDEEVTVMLSMGAGSTTSASDYSIMPASVTFPERERGSYTATMMVEVEAKADDELDDMEMLVLDAEVAGGVTAHGSDNDMYMGVSTLTIEEGTMALVSAKSQADVEKAVYDAKMAGMGADEKFTRDEVIEIAGSDLFDPADGVTLTFTADSTMDTVAPATVMAGKVMVTAGAVGEAEITITAHASASGVMINNQTAPGTASIKFPVEVELEDLSVGLSATATGVEEGGSLTLTATANRAVTADTMVTLMRDAASTAGMDDYSLDPETGITIRAGELVGTAMLMATDDHDVEGNESLMLNGMVGDTAAGSVMITIEDNDVETTYTLSASAETLAEGGEAVTITATASQAVMENTEVMVMRDGASTAGEDDYSLEPPLITIMAGETEGSLTLTATDDTDVEGEEKLTLNGMVGEMAAGSVMLAITDNDMDITYTLSGPEDMNIAEGGSVELTATASGAVPMDTEVMVMRDGSSTASDADFTAESIMILAGETTGTTMVMAVEDNEPDSGSGSPEMLTLYGMVDGMQTNSVSFYLWDAAVPALPVIAQLLLAAFLALGGYRRYRRR